jgi:thiamine kinase-like enzyme
VQVARLLRRLHDCPALPTSFDVFRLVERQRELAVSVPESYDRVMALGGRIEAALAPTHPEHRHVPCHNDLLTANFVRDGWRICIVDWEYAGMNDRYFDLGNLAVNNGFGPDDERALLEAYWDAPPTDRQAAALSLMRLVSDLREAMWGAVQRGRSTLDFDYEAYANEHFGRLEQAAADPRVEEWLAVAAAA